jgi:hypothetical protein
VNTWLVGFLGESIKTGGPFKLSVSYWSGLLEQTAVFKHLSPLLFFLPSARSKPDRISEEVATHGRREKKKKNAEKVFKSFTACGGLYEWGTDFRGFFLSTPATSPPPPPTPNILLS